MGLLNNCVTLTPVPPLGPPLRPESSHPRRRRPISGVFARGPFEWHPFKMSQPSQAGSLEERYQTQYTVKTFQRPVLLQPPLYLVGHN